MWGFLYSWSQTSLFVVTMHLVQYRPRPGRHSERAGGWVPGRVKECLR